MKFSLWLEGRKSKKVRNQKSATKMPEVKSSLQLAQDAAKKNIHGMQHGRAGSHDNCGTSAKFEKGTRGEKNRKAISDYY